MDNTRLAAQKIEQDLSVELRRAEGGTTPVPATLSYDSANPCAVTMAFHLADGPVPWTFGRDLLSGGLTAPTGDGDVHVWPGLDDAGLAVVSVELCSPHGNALVEVRTSDADDFIEATKALVAPGAESEHWDMDALISALLADRTA
jgi:hypothetical protein